MNDWFDSIRTVEVEGGAPRDAVVCDICFCALPYNQEAHAKHHDWHISMGQADARGASWA